jgi:hypothetical protein
MNWLNQYSTNGYNMGANPVASTESSPAAKLDQNFFGEYTF